MQSQKYLKYVYGPASAFSEYQPGDVIRYLERGREQTGTLLWVCAPRDLGTRYTGITYVVEPAGSGRPDIVSPANALTSSESAQG